VQLMALARKRLAISWPRRPRGLLWRASSECLFHEAHDITSISRDSTCGSRPKEIKNATFTRLTDHGSKVAQCS
jgi:hypothetical protein